MLLEVEVCSTIQIQTLKNVITLYDICARPFEVRPRLQVENAASGVKCLRMTMQLSQEMQVYLAKARQTLMICIFDSSK
jgi:hypothetical protein